MPRIVTLLAAATEIVSAVGAGDELVGVSHECDYPPGAVAGRPVLTTARVGSLATSAGVDRSVRQLVADALAVYDVDVELLAALAPEVIVTQDLCRVCAVSLDDVRAAVARLAARADVTLVSLHPRSLDAILHDIARVAHAVGRPAAGERVVAGLRERIEHVRTVTSRSPSRPRVVTVEWIEPVMLGGLWMPELVELAGGEPLGVAAGAPAPTVTRDILARLAPDVVLVKPCGLTVERTLAELPVLARTLPWTAWTGPGRAARVYVADGNAYFNRSGPRIVDSLELLAAVLHPGRFPDHATQLTGAAVRIGPDLAVLPATTT
ncbi:MAG TPA: ABC transporter substrate-binding protein [Actinomycetes bacterium]|nr:ABC transporter substrate-binding protein [Actinomycetes bacterium]